MNRQIPFLLFSLIGLFALTACGTSALTPQQQGESPWEAWLNKDIAALSNDNTGATFALDSAVTTPAGNPSVRVTPSGDAAETKVAFTAPGSAFALWNTREAVELEVYISPENTLPPTDFFLGVADTSAGFTWLGGLFSETEVTSGWNRVRIVLPAELRDFKEDGSYTLYFSSMAKDDAQANVPLTEPFNLGDVYLVGEAEPGTPEANKEPDPAVDAEVDELLALDNDALLETISKRTFDYFWNEANPNTGLIKDRSTEDSPSSIAAVGFGLSSIPIAVERGWITRDEGYQRTLTTLETFANGGVEGQRGFYYHFVDMATGRRAYDSELSSIDTALFIAGALTAGEYFDKTEVSRLADKLYRKVDWVWMQGGDDGLVRMGWSPEGGFLKARWGAGFDEGLLLYILAIGAPKHRVSAELWDEIARPVREDYNGDPYIYIAAEPLFIYQYPLAWLNLRDMEDSYANYPNNTAIACERNADFSAARAGEYETYQNGVWGLSASDGPTGYKAYGAAEGNHDGTIAPYASIACLPFTEDLAWESLRAMLGQYKSLVWGDYGFVSAINEDELWYSYDYIGIDQGDILLNIENYRTGQVWNLFMQNKRVRKALKRVGFAKREADYAVTPAYLEEVREREAEAQQPVSGSTATTAVTVDGQLTDWAGSSWYTVTEAMNIPVGGVAKVDPTTQTLHSRFAIRYDTENLYLAADVSDDTVVSNIAPDDLQNFYRTDSAEFYLDPESDAGLFKLSVLPFDTEGTVQAVRHEDAQPGPIATTAPGAEVASSRTDGGYIVEVKIPLTLLGITGQAGTELGFSHVIHNANDPDAAVGADVRENIIGWNPVPDVWITPDRWSVLTLE